MMRKIPDNKRQESKEEMVSNETETLQKAVDVVKNNFNLSNADYEVVSFSNNHKTMKTVLENAEFKVAVDIKHPVNHGLASPTAE